MNIKDVKEWFILADDDFDSANILSNAVKKHNEIICYLCAQAVEKYLKGYLIYNDIVPERTHNLIFLNSICIEKDKAFEYIKTECGLVNRFVNDIRYPHKMETKLEDVNMAIKSVEKIRNIEPLIKLRNIIDNNENNIKQSNFA
ncbi:MAG: HEPN domain-containing protein [Treponema sp.]|jgi:HEPN domain-containing protein|nr:HEPN domain-containing protein [Treponema sp.]